VVRLFDLNLPGWTGGGWFFNPLAWQALFFIGCALGYVPRVDGRRGTPPAVSFHPLLAAAAGLVLATGAAAMLLVDADAERFAGLPEHVALVLADVDKTSLHPFRLVSMLALAYLLGHLVPFGAGWLRSHAAAPFVLMGQHGLPVFCTGIFLSFLGRLALEQAEGWPMQLAVNLAGFLVLVGVGVIAAWYRLREQAPLPRPAVDALPDVTTSTTTPAQ
jgi:hypothetical protein